MGAGIAAGGCSPSSPSVEYQQLYQQWDQKSEDMRCNMFCLS